MPKSITIRNVPDETTQELAAKAARTGRSLQEYLRSRLIEMAEAESVEDVLARIRARKAATGSTLSAQKILEYRDDGRR